MSNLHRARGALVAAGALALVGASIGVGLQSAASATVHHRTSPSGHVLLVGTYKGVAGGYATVQSAVNAAQPGDWILVAPGDYHETDDLTSPPSSYSTGAFGGVLITKSSLHLRGMSRSGVVLDGTKQGARKCSSAPGDQQYGRVVAGKAVGRNGIVVYKANNVSIDNLEVCNFFSGTQGAGNGIWWNGGANSGKIGMTGYEGSYLTATDSYFAGEATAGTYGIFSSNAQGPATWNQLYANNQNDSGIYVGACKQLCNVTISNAWMEYNALGYSGTNSGGAIVITHSVFDHNQDGFDTNTSFSGDPTAPQNGACPNNGISPITHTHSCWVLEYSTLKDNNNANAPATGSAAIGPIGTGMTMSGGRNDTIMHDIFSGNGAWGLLVIVYPDGGTGVMGQTCANTGGHILSGLGCIFDPQNDAVLANTFTGNGTFHNPTNSDIGELTYATHAQNCYAGNVVPDHTFPKTLQALESKCSGKAAKGNAFSGALSLFLQAECDAGLTPGKCPKGTVYPKHGAVQLHAVPSGLASMPNPCLGVPSNPWCVAGKPI